MRIVYDNAKARTRHGRLVKYCGDIAKIHKIV